MKNYIIRADDGIVEIPGVYDEQVNAVFTAPSLVADSTYQFDTDAGARTTVQLKTRPKEGSNVAYNRLYGYIRGRAGQKETIYLERMNGTVEGYVRFPSVSTNFQGKIQNKREMNIQIIIA